MGRRLKIRNLESGGDARASSFRFWIFGEDVFTYCRDTKLASVTLKEVDAVADILEIRAIKARNLRRVIKSIEGLLEKHGFAQFELTVERED